MSVMASRLASSFKTIKPEIRLNSNLKNSVFAFQNTALFHYKDHSVRHNAVQRCMLLESKFVNKISEQNTFFLNVTACCTERQRERETWCVLFNDALNC